MYLTIFTTSKQETVLPSFEEVLLNPYLTIEQPNIEIQKRTIIVSEEYGKKLYDKRITNTMHEVIIASKPPAEIPADELAQHYNYYTIAKRTDPTKRRQIEDPDGILRTIQGHYKYIIDEILKVQAHDAAFGYIKQRDIKRSTERHQKNESRWFLKLDLKDFFPSINEEFLRKQLDMVYPFRFLPGEFMEGLIKYSLLNNSLPQGTYTSPLLSNLVMVPIDYDITKALTNYNKHHFVYTRYADDIEISCKEKFDPREITAIVSQIFKDYNAPFRINHEKTTFGSNAGSNYHLGLNLNKDNQISKGYRKNNKFRAMLHQFALNPNDASYETLNKILGTIAHFRYIEPGFVEKTLHKYNEKFNIDIEKEIKRRLACQESK